MGSTGNKGQRDRKTSAHLRQEQQPFLVKVEITNIFGSAGPMSSATATQVCPCVGWLKTSIGSMLMNLNGCVSIKKLFIKKQASGLIWLVGNSL